MSDIDSDIENYFKTPSLQDQLDDLQHFICDLTRKLGIMENKILENQDELYKLNVRLGTHQNSYTKITAIIIYLLTIIILLFLLINV